MKTKREHRVPLSPAAVDLLEAQPQIDGCAWVFPGNLRRPLSDVAISKLCGEISGDRCVPHGWRSTFRDWAGDHTAFPRELAEAALSHIVGGVEGAYRRGDAVERRRPLMAEWAKFLVTPVKKPAEGENNVIGLHDRGEEEAA
jgi:integrase